MKFKSKNTNKPKKVILIILFPSQVDAYLTPCIKKYLESFASGFVDDLEGVKVAFMQSDGGLTPMNSFNGSRAILSGPAGGVVGYAMTTSAEQKVTTSLTLHNRKKLVQRI
jgi:N-methylhydantoinase A/oxoprolinase/acetone carboxylase beta subunit